jgi:hypothetical protein
MKVFARIALLAALAAGVTLAAAPAAQQPKGKDKAKEKEKEKAPPAPEPDTRSEEEKTADTAKVVEKIADAYKFMELAEKQKAPEMYVGAGRLFLQLQKETEKRVRSLDEKPEVQTADGKTVAGAKVDSENWDSFDAIGKECLDKALSLANTQGSVNQIDPLVKAVSKDPYGPGERGAAGGPKIIVRPIAPGQTHVYTIAFITATPGAIGFASSVPMRCQMQTGEYVHFNQVVRTGQYSWQPKRNEAARTYVISIHNGTNAVGQYRLFTN